MIKCCHVIEATDMTRTDENLRHRVAAIGAAHHFLAQLGVARYIIFDETGPLGIQKAFGGMAIAAQRLCIDLDIRHPRIPFEGVISP